MSAPDPRKGFIAALVEKGKTREQAEAFLAIMGSAFRRRGWVEGEPMADPQIKANLETFLGDQP